MKKKESLQEIVKEAKITKKKKEKSVQEMLKEEKTRNKRKKEVLEKVAKDLGFDDDNYYTAGEKMVEKGESTDVGNRGEIV